MNKPVEDTRDKGKIPLARERLELVARELEMLRHPDVAETIREIVDTLMWRAKETRPRAPRKSNTLTPDMEQAIVVIAKARPTMQLSEIAHMFGVNAGRISTVLQQAAAKGAM